MCAIWGSVGLASTPRALLSVLHRGPDAEGWVEEASPAGPLHIGHRLLAIAGDRPCPQPLRGSGGDVLAYNGEIYNAADLAEQLGCVDRLKWGDAPVARAALAAWGVDALARFQGMFALIYFSPRTQTLIAARDAFGIKPLYLWRGPEGFAFASEIKQFVEVPGFSARLNADRAREFLRWGVSDHTEQTLLRDVESVLPGMLVEVHLRSERPVLRIRPWRSAPCATPTHASDDLAQVLRTAVAARTQAKAPVALALSGGIDSSTIACLSPTPLPAFTLAHDDSKIDESRYARVVAARHGMALTEVRIRESEVLASAEQLAVAMDEPFPSLSALAQWFVFREAAQQGYRVVLTGQGADELFGGYRMLLGPLLLDLLGAGNAARAWKELTAFPFKDHGVVMTAARALLTTLAPQRLLDWLARTRWGDPGLARARVAGGVEASAGLSEFRRALLGPANLSMLLRYEDRTAMAHSVEARPPFLDSAVIACALRMKSSELIENGFTKAPLRRITERLMPDDVRLRRDKLGFPAPEAAWLRGPLRAYALDHLRFVATAFSDLAPAGALEAARRALDAEGPLRAPVWSLVSFGAWAARMRVC